MAIFMLSLTGVPPLVGFTGKFYVFSAAVEAGYIGLAVIAGLIPFGPFMTRFRLKGETPSFVARKRELISNGSK